MALLFVAPLTALSEAIDSFDYESSESAKAAWRAIDPAPAVSVVGKDNAVFPVPFKDGKDRVYWDRDGEWDFSSYQSFELDLACDQPSAMRSLSIYFRSGQGWYVWNKPLSAAGRQKITLAKIDFQTEGSPAGWSKIDKIRISPWKGQAIDTDLTLYHFAGRIERLFIVQAGKSIPDSTERANAKKAADRISRWLAQSGIGHAVIPEEQMEKASETATIMILPYNPMISASQLSALRSMAARGGKFMIFYSSDSNLAKLMQVKLGAAISTRDIARWRGIEFADPLPGVPLSAHQQSWIIGPAEPASENTKTIAYWINAAGQRSGDAAILASPNGYWFTHLLLDDDRRVKQRLIAGMVASLDPSLWEVSAQHMRANAGRIDGWRTASETTKAIEALAVEGHPDAETVLAFLRRFESKHTGMIEYIEAGRYRDAVVAGYEAHDLLQKAYGLAQMPAEDEFRAVWDHDATGWYPGDWDRTARLLKESGINNIFINATWAGLAHYESTFVPESFTYQLYGDQLASCIRAAREHGLSVHAWIVLWSVENSRPEFTAPLKNSGRLQHDSKGREISWMNPAHPENVQHMLNLVREILGHYEVDGIHLDYVRYPSGDACYSEYTREKFTSETGVECSRWPGDVRPGGPSHDAFVQWRAATIHSFVREVRELVEKTKPEAKLSAAVWGAYPQIIQSIGQDWGSWLRDGLVDFLTPMNYAEDLYRFTALADQQLQLPGARGKIFPGIGVTANESQLSGDEVVQQIVALRQRGIKGFALFDLSQTLVDDTLPTLRLGVTRPR